MAILPLIINSHPPVKLVERNKHHLYPSTHRIFRHLFRFQLKHTTCIIKSTNVEYVQTRNYSPIQKTHTKSNINNDIMNSVVLNLQSEEQKQKYDLISTYYKAAGILPYAYNSQNEPYFFLGEENYKMKKGFCDFGGKIEKDDFKRPELTAFREFTEETEGLFTTTEYNILREKLIKEVYSAPVIWNKPARYVLFLLHIPLLVDQSYKTNRPLQSPTHHNHHRDYFDPPKLSYRWFAVNSLCTSNNNHIIINNNNNNNNGDRNHKMENEGKVEEGVSLAARVNLEFEGDEIGDGECRGGDDTKLISRFFRMLIRPYQVQHALLNYLRKPPLSSSSFNCIISEL